MGLELNCMLDFLKFIFVHHRQGKKARRTSESDSKISEEWRRNWNLYQPEVISLEDALARFPKMAIYIVSTLNI
jgi:hypothetical protein